MEEGKWYVLFRFEKPGNGKRVIGEFVSTVGECVGCGCSPPADQENFIRSIVDFVKSDHDYEGSTVPAVRMKGTYEWLLEMALEFGDIDRFKHVFKDPDLLYRAITERSPSFTSLEDQALAFRDNSKQPLEDEWYRHIKPAMLNLLEPYQEYDSAIYDYIYNSVYDVLFEKTTGSKP